MTYLGTKFKVAMSNGLGGDAFTRNVTDGRTDGQTDKRTTDRLWYEINIPAGINSIWGVKMSRFCYLLRNVIMDVITF